MGPLAGIGATVGIDTVLPVLRACADHGDGFVCGSKVVLFTCQHSQVASAFADGVRATAASEVSSRNVMVSCRYSRTAPSLWLR